MTHIPFTKNTKTKAKNGQHHNIRGGTYLTKINFLKFFRRFLMFIYVSNQDQKFFLGDLKIRVRVRPYYFVTYQNLSGEP